MFRLILLMVLATGCVTTGTHEMLQKECASTKARLEGELAAKAKEVDTLKKDVEGRDATLAENQDSIEQLETHLVAARRDLGASEDALQKLQAELASTLKDRSRLRASIQDMQRALADVETRRRQAEARVAEFRKLVDRFKPLIDTGKLRVKIVDGRMVVELATDVLFGSGSAKLSKDGEEALREVTTVLSSVEGRRFQVEGHTDNVPIKTAAFPSNWELAAQRSINVVKTMISAGMPAERVSAASFSEHKPAGPNETPEGKAQNRRIEIVVVPDLSSLPGFEALQQAAGAS